MRFEPAFDLRWIVANFSFRGHEALKGHGKHIAEKSKRNEPFFLREHQAARIDRGRVGCAGFDRHDARVVSAPMEMRTISRAATPPRSANMVMIRSWVSPGLPMAMRFPLRSAALLMLGSATR